MTKAMRQMSEDVKLVDLIIELLDARVSLSSRNPDINTLGRGKARLIILNKADLADQAVSDKWLDYFAKEGHTALLLDSRNPGGMGEIRKAVDKVCREKKERDLKRGIKNRPARAMVAGIPNAGKSTFINSIAKKAVAKTGNRPGVTRGKQWIRLNPMLELLDTPGVLWPKFEDPSVGLHLAMTGAINDDILPREELAGEILQFLSERYPGRIAERYGIDEEGELTGAIARRLGCLKAGGEADLLRASGAVVDDFRSGRLGRISIERT